MNRYLVYILLPLLLAAGWQREPPPSHIFHTGKIVTVDPQFRIVEAMAIRDGRIVAVGRNADIVRLAGSGTEQVNLGGKTVLPGLIDSHVHAPAASMYEFEQPIPDMETVDDVLAYVRARAEKTDPGRWITLSQVFITRLREQRYPTRAELDKAAPRHPVAFRTGPDASLNSMALTMSGIDAKFQVPAGEPCRVERDPSGQPTGILRNCGRYIRSGSSGSSPSIANRLARLRELLADYNSVGFTSIVDANTDREGLELYRTLLGQKALTCRTFMAYGVDAQAPLDKIEAAIREAASNPLHQHNDMLWLRGIKAFMDGGMLTGSAYMRQPWGVSKIYAIDDPEYRGVRFIEAEKLYQIAKLALANDLQFTAHSQGDAAVDAMVEAYERINRDDFPVRDRRPSITHASFMSAEAIAKMKALGIVANMQPAWLYLDGTTLRQQFGVERLAYFHPYRTLFQEGVTVGGGSDHMQKIGSLRSINPYNPFLAMWTTLVRQPRGSEAPLHPEQNLTREQAIRLYTINNAFLTFEETRKGSLEPGKLADFIVLDRDILSCPIDEVKDIKVEATYLGGARVYERPGRPVLAQDPTAFGEVDRTMENYRLDAHIPGMVWGIVQDGRLVHMKGAGVQDIDTKRPVTAETLFRIASMTKAFTALSILKLRDEGKLTLDAPVETYVPELRGWKYPTDDSPKIRVRELLTHTAGFVTDDPWGDRQTPLPEEDFTRLLRDGVPFSRPPAMAMEYSNLGYALLGRTVTNVSGQPYKAFVQRLLLMPLGMTSTGYDVAAAPVERRALGYRWEDNAWKVEPTMAHGAFGAMGGIQTSANDYAKWVAYLLSAWPPRDGADTGPVRRSSVRELAQGANFPSLRLRPGSSGLEACREASTYGMGFYAATDCELGLTLSHSGGYPGYGSHVLLLPDYGVGIFALANRTYAGPRPPVWDAAVSLLRAGRLQPRSSMPSSALTTAYSAIATIFTTGSVTSAGDVLAMNFLMDRDAEHRARDLSELKAQVGTCDTAVPMTPASALAGSFTWRCEHGRVKGEVLLAPTPTPRIQSLTLTRSTP